MKRRTLIIIIVSLILVVILGIWLYLRSTRTQEVTTEGVVTQVLGSEDVRLRLTEQEIADGKTLDQKESEIRSAQNSNRDDLEAVTEVTIKKILNQRVSHSVLSSDKNDIFFFDEEQGEFFRTDLKGDSVQQITTAGFKNLLDAKWSLARNSAILYFSNNDFTKRLISFNFSDQSFNDLGNNVVEAALSPDGSEIVYLFQDEETGVSNISSAQADGSKWKILQQLSKDDVVLEWPNPFRFLVGEVPTSYKQTDLKSFGITGTDIRTIAANGFGISHKVSPDGNKVIYTVGSSRSDELFLFVSDISGSFHKDLEVSTMAEKCAFAEDNVTIFCGVPQKGNVDYVLPDDYLEGNMVTNDSFFRINTETGDKERLAGASEFGATYDVFEPFVSPSGRTMYFQRKQDGNLYALLIP